MALSPKQFAAALDEIPNRSKGLLLSFLEYASNRLGQTATEKYMRDAGKGAGPRDPNDAGPLRVVTGRLARSLTGGQFAPVVGGGGRESIQEIESTEDGVKLTYGSAVPYAAVHEYGFSGTVNVPKHTRTITQAFGRPINPRSIFIDAYSYRANIPKRPYLQPALEDNMDTLQEEIADRFWDMIQKVLEG